MNGSLFSLTTALGWGVVVAVVVEIGLSSRILKISSKTSFLSSFTEKRVFLFFGLKLRPFLGFEKLLDGKLFCLLKNLEVSNVLGDSGGVEKSSESISKAGLLDGSVKIVETKGVLTVVSCSN